MVCKKIIYLPVETSSRELQSRLLIATSLREPDVTAVIAPTNVIGSVAQKIPGVYLHKRHGLGDLFLIEQLTDCGNVVVAIDEEDLIGPPTVDWGKTSSNPHVLYLLSAVFANSGPHLLALQASSPQHTSHFVLSGNPRVELTTAALTNFRRSLHPRSIPREPFVLINTNFSSGNFSRSYGMGAIEQRQRLNSVFGEDRSSAERKLQEEELQISRDRLRMRSYVLAIRQLATHYSRT